MLVNGDIQYGFRRLRSHADSVLGVVSAEDVAAGKVAIIAPGDDFDEHALGENVICGNVCPGARITRSGRCSHTTRS